MSAIAVTPVVAIQTGNQHVETVRIAGNNLMALEPAAHGRPASPNKSSECGDGGDDKRPDDILQHGDNNSRKRLGGDLHAGE
ncbi:hypothetical protein CKO21_07140 [Rhodovibrio salinarum]|uniref:Uncharacterized protein n=1 Tax=Rhodovibrio salinarum TaxID=1087 RepID=A0A934V029_9PROT|nr:hypothetical protein [Rhodovibrio salinarum]